VSKNNSAPRVGYNTQAFEKNFDTIFGTEAERKERNKLAKVQKETTRATNKSAQVLKSFEEFKSTVDGAIVSDRRQLREHNERNGVTDARDYSDNYMDTRRKDNHRRDEVVQTKGRIEAIQQTMRIKGYD
jgi:hypothetical protein